MADHFAIHPNVRLGAGLDEQGAAILFARDPFDGEVMFILSFPSTEAAAEGLRRWLELVDKERPLPVFDPEDAF